MEIIDIHAKMEKLDLTLFTFVQYIEDFCFWMNVASRTHRFQDKEIAKCFVSGLKRDVFVKCIRVPTRPWSPGSPGRIICLFYFGSI